MHPILQQAQKICDNNLKLKSFCRFNTSAANNNLNATKTSASVLFKETTFGGSKETLPMIDAVKRHVCDANWRQTYSISEVGEDFANRHCYFELLGPTGHFYNDDIRGFICYWGNHLNYKWHSHEAEEIYYILGGKALFKTKTMTKVLRANETQFHKSWESHAMETLEEPLLAFILWRGNGLDKLAQIDD